MISRYALYDIAEISKYFNLPDGLPKGVKPHYNYSPTASAPVIVSRDGVRVIEFMKWGLVAKGAKDTNSVFRYKTYEIPSEKIFMKENWVQAIRTSRCLIPANGFYDLSTSGEKRAVYTQSSDTSLLALAGVYGSWQDPEGVVHGTFSVLTTDTTDDAPHGSGRMPVIIKPEDEARWLDPEVIDASSTADMLRPYPHELLRSYEVGSGVHSPKQDQPNLIEQI